MITAPDSTVSTAPRPPGLWPRLKRVLWLMQVLLLLSPLLYMAAFIAANPQDGVATLRHYLTLAFWESPYDLLDTWVNPEWLEWSLYFYIAGVGYSLVLAAAWAVFVFRRMGTARVRGLRLLVYLSWTLPYLCYLVGVIGWSEDFQAFLTERSYYGITVVALLLHWLVAWAVVRHVVPRLTAPGRRRRFWQALYAALILCPVFATPVIEIAIGMLTMSGPWVVDEWLAYYMLTLPGLALNAGPHLLREPFALLLVLPYLLITFAYAYLCVWFLDHVQDYWGGWDRALDRGDFEHLATLLRDHPRLVESRRYGLTPLIEAVERRDLELVSFLLMHEADVNGRSEHRTTALHHAAAGDAALVRLLLGHGARPLVRNVFGETPMHRAAAAGNLEAAALLVEADSWLLVYRDRRRRLPLDCCRDDAARVWFSARTDPNQRPPLPPPDA